MKINLDTQGRPINLEYSGAEWDEVVGKLGEPPLEGKPVLVCGHSDLYRKVRTAARLFAVTMAAQVAVLALLTVWWLMFVMAGMAGRAAL